MCPSGLCCPSAAAACMQVHPGIFHAPQHPSKLTKRVLTGSSNGLSHKSCLLHLLWEYAIPTLTSGQLIVATKHCNYVACILHAKHGLMCSRQLTCALMVRRQRSDCTIRHCRLLNLSPLDCRSCPRQNTRMADQLLYPRMCLLKG